MNIDTVRKALEALNSGIELAEEGMQYKRAAYAGHLHLLRADEQTIQDMHTQATALRAELERLEGVEPGTARPACVDGRCPDRRECDVARACLHHTAPASQPLRSQWPGGSWRRWSRPLKC